MDKKQKQIEELGQDIYDNCPDLCDNGCGGKPCYKCIAERLYNDGYRRTFTSAFASDTQAAYKEGYRKGQKEAIKGLIDEWENNNEKYIDFGDFSRRIKRVLRGIEMILYLCDGKKCAPCGRKNGCMHTTDIKHAVNFKNDDCGNMVEPPAFIETHEERNKDEDFVECPHCHKTRWNMKGIWRIAGFCAHCGEFLEFERCE